jgi:tetratricopeptide (TPR) repeat protein
MATSYTLLEESLTLFYLYSDDHRIGDALGQLGHIRATQGDREQARTFLEESAVRLRRAGALFELSGTLNDLGSLELDCGNMALALEMCEESLSIRRMIGDRRGSTAILANLTRIALAAGQVLQAREFLSKQLSLSHELAYAQGYVWGLRLAAQIVSATEQYKAARLLGAEEALRVARVVPLWPDEQAAYEQQVAMTRSALSAEDFATAWATGQALSLDEALAYAQDW